MNVCREKKINADTNMPGWLSMLFTLIVVAIVSAILFGVGKMLLARMKEKKTDEAEKSLGGSESVEIAR